MTEQQQGQKGPDLSGQIAKQQASNGTASAFDLVSSMQAEFGKALPAEVPVEKFMRLAVTELRNSPQLQEASAPSLLGALMTAARLGLEVGGPLGEFYLTPRRNKGELQVVPIVGYQGLLKLAKNAGVGAIDARIVREGDHFREGAASGRGFFYEWEPQDDDDTRKPVGVLAVAELDGGRDQHAYMSVRKVHERRDRGAAGNKGPWSTDYEAMVLKTGLRALAARLPKSTDTLALSRRADEQVQHYRAGDMVADMETGEIEA